MDEGDREHQLRETVRPKDHDSAGEPRQRTAENAGGEHEERIGDAEMHGRDTGGIGAAAEQRGMAEGRDAAIAGDEIEREYQQRDRGDAGEQRQIVRKEEIADPGQHEDHREARKIAAEPPACPQKVPWLLRSSLPWSPTSSSRQGRAERRRQWR